MISANSKEQDLICIGAEPLPDNTILHDIKTATTYWGNITFDKNVIAQCAQAVAQYIKHNPDALKNVPMD